MRCARILLFVLLAVGCAVIAIRVANGSQDPDGAAPKPVLERLSVGRGAQAAAVFDMRGAERRPAIVFLHGWGLKGPQAYRPWLEHLARRGSTVVVPRYQTSLRSRPDRALRNAAAGIRAALRRVPVGTGGVVFAGHSAGAALAADLAAGADRLGLPSPRGLLLMFPGRAIRDFPAGLPAQDLSGIAKSTRTVVVASTVDQVVGDGPAREMHATLAANGLRDLELSEITDPVLGEHFAPARAGRPMRRHFWGMLDRLVARVGR